jgi:hypothetical protein
LHLRTLSCTDSNVFDKFNFDRSVNKVKDYRLDTWVWFKDLSLCPHMPNVSDSYHVGAICFFSESNDGRSVKLAYPIHLLFYQTHICSYVGGICADCSATCNSDIHIAYGHSFILTALIFSHLCYFFFVNLQLQLNINPCYTYL